MNSIFREISMRRWNQIAGTWALRAIRTKVSGLASLGPLLRERCLVWSF